jgi:hypothetical protein
MGHVTTSGPTSPLDLIASLSAEQPAISWTPRTEDRDRFNGLSTFPSEGTMVHHNGNMIPQSYTAYVNNTAEVMVRQTPALSRTPRHHEGRLHQPTQSSLDLVLYQSLLIHQPDGLSAFFPSTEQRFQVSAKSSSAEFPFFLPNYI